MKTVAVSACLLGINCKYNGGNNRKETVAALADRYDLIPICPESLGGLPCPRDPSEICGDRVVMKNGTDVTEAFRLGAERALRIAEENRCTVAILKQNSPSCGSECRYDGTFSGTLIHGMGVTAELFTKHGIAVTDEHKLHIE